MVIFLRIWPINKFNAKKTLPYLDKEGVELISVFPKLEDLVSLRVRVGKT